MNKRKLPPYVVARRACYLIGRYDPETRKTTYRRLCGSKATMSEVWAAFEALSMPEKGTFRWLSGMYMASEQFRKKADKTRKEYQRNHRTVCDTDIKGGKLGDAPLAAWSPPVVRKYLDRRPGPTGNREKAYISLVFNWGIERGHARLNPAKGVRRNPEQARTRYVTNEEYQAAYAAAPGHVQVVMELAYMMRARLAEVLDLTRDSIKDEGVLLIRRKNSKSAIVTWTPRLRDAITAAKRLPKYNEINRHFFQSKDGTRMRESTIQSAWQRIKPKPTFTIHDLKAKGVSDFEGDKLAAGGWKDAKMLNTYNRKIEHVPPTE